jgi:hypothetical protein
MVLPIFTSDTWLGRQTACAKVSWQALSMVLYKECSLSSGDRDCKVPVAILEADRQKIQALPEKLKCLDGDLLARQYSVADRIPCSTDIYYWLFKEKAFVLVECKFKAYPETSQVKTPEAFEEKIARKFDASQRFLTENQCVFNQARLVLFNSESKDNVFRMFQYLKLASETPERYESYHILALDEFAAQWCDGQA